MPTIKPQLDSRLTLLKRLFKSTLLIFRNEGNKISKIRLLIALVLVIAYTYQSSYFVYHFKPDKTRSLSDVLPEVNWSIRCLVSVYFVIYWQFGHFQAIFSLETWAPLSQNLLNSKKSNRRKWKIYFVFILATILLICLIIYISYQYYFNESYHKSHTQMYELFKWPGSSSIGLLLKFLQWPVWTIILLFFNLILSRILDELEVINEQLEKVGSDSKNIQTELLAQYDNLVNLKKLIKQINSMFEVYTFCMIGSNVLVTIFTIVNLFESSGIVAILINLEACSVCMFELFALVMPPARIYEALKSVEDSVLFNKKIWIPHNQQKYQIAFAIIEQSKQDVGITIWGLVTITKSMILTVASLTVTYLIIVLQMKPADVKQ